MVGVVFLSITERKGIQLVLTIVKEERKLVGLNTYKKKGTGGSTRESKDNSFSRELF